MDHRPRTADVDFLRAVVEASEEALFVIRTNGDVVYATNGVERLIGRRASELVGAHAGSFVAAQDVLPVRTELTRMVRTRTKRSSMTLEIVNSRGQRQPVRFEIVNEYENPSLQGFLFVVRDLEESLSTEDELQQSRRSESYLATIAARFASASAEETERDLHASLVEVAAMIRAERVMIWTQDDLGRMFIPVDEHCSSDATDIAGRDVSLTVSQLKSMIPEALEGEVVHLDPIRHSTLLDYFCGTTRDGSPMQRSAEAGGPFVSVFPMRVGGKVIGFLTLTSLAPVLWTDTSVSFINALSSLFGNAINRRTAERAMAYQALHDPLTGLPNRSLLLDRLGLALARSARNGENVSVMLIDLDGFKDVNDTLGHEAGDLLLKVISARLIETLRDADSVARLGGDEFVAVAETATDEINAKTVAGRIIEVLRQPVMIGEQQVQVSGSIGLVIANASLDRTLDASSLIRKADIAMYRAKTAGRDRVEVFSNDMEERIRRRFELLDDLRRGLAAGELVAWYQPIIDVASGRLTSFEALVRWMHPTKGIVPPFEFIELAEGSGVVHELGQTVLNQAVSQLAQWRNGGRIEPDVTISVNVSVRQLLSMSFVDVVRETLLKYGLPASLLHLEITESVFADRHLVTAPLLRLRDLGVRVSIDDFGTGYSSLSYLRDLPIDCLKIDRSFVQGLGCDRRDNALVGAVVGMAAELGLEVVAEGVETQEQLAQLERLGCRSAQGYLFGRPAPAAQVDIPAAIDDTVG